MTEHKLIVKGIHTIYCPDLQCESCVKVVRKTLTSIGIENPKFTDETLQIELKADQKIEGVLNAIRARNYRASLLPFKRKTLFERWKDFRTNKHKYATEYQLLQYASCTFLILIGLHILGYVAVFSQIPEFISRFAQPLLYLNLAVVSIGSAMWHFKSYKTSVTSMVGMMIGMTFGMQTGMLLGTILGITNGLSLAGTVAMVVAAGVGVYNGKCCGIMGVMEGAMAGVMGGVMGSMIGTMFTADHFFLFMPLFVVLNVLILTGLSYMLFEEMVEDHQSTTRNPLSFSTFVSYCITIVFALTVIMIYGPKTGLAFIGGII